MKSQEGTGIYSLAGSLGGVKQQLKVNHLQIRFCQFFVGLFLLTMTKEEGEMKHMAFFSRELSYLGQMRIGVGFGCQTDMTPLTVTALQPLLE